MIDMHVHASEVADISLENTLSDGQVEEVVARLAGRLNTVGVRRALVILMDTRFPGRPEALKRLPPIAQTVQLDYCQLLDFRSARVEEDLDALAALGIAGVKIHPYLQALDPAEFDRLVEVAAAAAARGLFLLVDGEYGSNRLFRVRPAEVVLRLAEAVAVPVLFAHAGGAAVLDALQVAEACPNVFLDLSFSLAYWGGSTAEQDFAFSIRKLGLHRWMYGSDAPFVPLEEARRVFDAFMVRFGFSVEEAEQILSSSPEHFWRAVEAARSQVSLGRVR